MRTIYANRGMALEQIIEITNNQYRQRKMAEIEKKPTPVKILKIIGNKVHGFLEKQSTVDFTGIVNKTTPKMVVFDAKETKGKSFPLKNIADHQIEHMKDMKEIGGELVESFLIVNFTELDKYYRLDIKDLLGYMREPYRSNLKSIPIKFFENYATEVKQGGGLYLDYLKGL